MQNFEAIRNRLLRSSAAAVVMLIGGVTVKAATLTGYDAGTNGNFFAQPIPDGTETVGETFQVQQDSLASSADAYISVTAGTTAGITLSLYATTPSLYNGPQPTGPALTSVTDPSSDVNSSFIEYIPFDFTTSVPLVADTTYAIVLTSQATDGNYDWYGDQLSYGNPSPYAYGNWIAQSAPGQQWAQQSSSAMGFHIYGSAVVPEPASIGLLGIIGAAVLARRRR